MALAVAIVPLAAPAASATDAIACVGFMHQRDGLWQSLSDDDVLGLRGPVHVRSGERLSPADPSTKGDIARALDNLCEAR